jgi:hypothetical protein
LPAFFTRLLAFLTRALVFGAMHPPPHMKEPVSGCKLRAPRYAAATRPPVPPLSEAGRHSPGAPDPRRGTWHEGSRAPSYGNPPMNTR